MGPVSSSYAQRTPSGRLEAHELFQRCGLSRRLVEDFLKPTLLAPRGEKGGRGRGGQMEPRLRVLFFLF